MITSGLVITLSADARLATRVVARLGARPEFTAGERNGRWLPVAMEAGDAAQSRALHDWLRALPGVVFVDIVYVNFDEDASSLSAAADVTRRAPLRAALDESRNLLASAAPNQRGAP